LESSRDQLQVVQGRGGAAKAALASMSDEDLVKQSLAGVNQAFTELAQRYHSRLINFVYRTIGDVDRAEDLAQETFVRVFRHLKRFDQRKKFSTWIYTIASNLSKNEIRNRLSSPLVLFQSLRKHWDADHHDMEFEDNSNRPDYLFRSRDLTETVEQAVRELPHHHRVVFVLREMEGLTYEEIASVTGITIGTVKSRLNRARTRFAQAIAPMVG